MSRSDDANQRPSQQRCSNSHEQDMVNHSCREQRDGQCAKRADENNSQHRYAREKCGAIASSAGAKDEIGAGEKNRNGDQDGIEIPTSQEIVRDWRRATITHER